MAKRKPEKPEGATKLDKELGVIVTSQDLAADDLQLDHTYQRTAVDEKKVSKIAFAFNPAAFGTLTVARRADGSFWVVDGQHRLQVALLLDMKDIPCRVFNSTGPKYEAAVFDAANTRVAVNPLDRFKASLVACDPVTVEINDILDSHGFIIGQSTRGNGISAVTTLYRLHKNNTLEGVMSVLESFEYCDSKVRQFACSHGMLYMHSVLVSDYLNPGHLDSDRLYKKLASLTLAQMREMEGGARAIVSGGSAPARGKLMAKLFIKNYYNRGLRAGTRIKFADD